jgi:pilus assembly protein Flp/PilA
MLNWTTALYVKAVNCARAAVNSDEEGQGMIEYGLLVALISIAAIVVIALIGPKLSNEFQDVVNAL